MKSGDRRLDRIRIEQFLYPDKEVLVHVFRSDPNCVTRQRLHNRSHCTGEKKEATVRLSRRDVRAHT